MTITRAELDTFPYRQHPKGGEFAEDEGYFLYISYGPRVVFVCRVNVFDWRVYIDSTNEIDHIKAVPSVLRIGTKVREDLARFMFPVVARWADSFGKKRYTYGR